MLSPLYWIQRSNTENMIFLLWLRKLWHLSFLDQPVPYTVLGETKTLKWRTQTTGQNVNSLYEIKQSLKGNFLISCLLIHIQYRIYSSETMGYKVLITLSLCNYGNYLSSKCLCHVNSTKGKNTFNIMHIHWLQIWEKLG